LVSLEPNQSSSAFESFLGAVGAWVGADSFGCSLNQSSPAGAGFSGTFLGFSVYLAEFSYRFFPVQKDKLDFPLAYH